MLTSYKDRVIGQAIACRLGGKSLLRSAEASALFTNRGANFFNSGHGEKAVRYSHEWR